jgi:hypothetical protein
VAEHPYRVSRYAHSRIYRWQWRCLQAEHVGVNPNPVRCPEGGVARSEDEAVEKAVRHAATHGARPS